jgi:hypothetical protein
MDTDIAPTHEASQPSRCTGVKRDGSPCKAPPMKGRDVCRAHGMTEGERRQFIESGVQARMEQAQQREAAADLVRKGSKVLIAEQLEADAEAVTARIRSLALSPDDQTAQQGIKLWLERVHGRAVQPSMEVADDSNPVVAAFLTLTPEERRALLRLAQPLPEEDNPASAQG